LSTYIKIAEALGDPIAAKAVKDALERERFAEFRAKIVDSAPHGLEVFNDFVSDRPLEQLARYQREQAEHIIRYDDLYSSDRIAGVDVSYQGDIAFREAPAIEAIAEHVSGFDVLMVNGHGIAHPRSCGLASYIGLRLDQPTIGVARTLLAGAKGEMGNSIKYKGAVVAAEICRTGHPSFYVSSGHRISLTSCVEIVVRMAGSGQLPEPLRLAHVEARRLMREL